MRALHVAAYYAPAFLYGGPPRSVHALCRALLRQGVDVQVFTTDANGHDALPASVTGSGTFEDVPVRYFARSFPRAPIGSSALVRALRREVGAFDVVHVHGLWNRVVWAAAREASRAGVPYVLSPRGMLEPAALAHRAWRKRAGWALVERHVVSGASLLHATSEAERRTLLRLRTGAPVDCIPNGIDLDPPPPRTAGESPMVLFVGRVHPIKRLDLLIDAFAAVRERRSHVRLVIAGPDESASISALLARAGRHAEAVQWVGPIGDAQRRGLLAQASALVMCSDAESFGMSVLEAMAAAVPVVVTRTCPWENVERHGAGCWVDQRADAIADAIVGVVDDPVSARAMGERGRALAEATYDWTRIGADMLDRYERVTVRRPVVAPLPATS